MIGSIALALPAQGAEQQSPLDQALAKAAQEGRPVLVLGTRNTCPLCSAFKQRMANDRKLRAMAAVCVSVELDADSPTSGITTLLAKKDPEGTKLPFFYLVRADGEIIIALQEVTSNPQIGNILRAGIAKSGRLLSSAEAKRYGQQLEKAKAAMERDDVGQVLSLLTPALKMDSHAGVVAESHKLVEGITTQAKTDLAKCEADLEAGGDLFPVALLLAEANHKYARLPDQKKNIGQLNRKLAQQENGKALLSQADEIVRARALGRETKGNRAMVAYEQIVKKYPDTPAASLAKEELAALEQKATDGANK